MVIKQQINKALWTMANSFYNVIYTIIFKEYSLAILFYKYLSDTNKIKQLKEKY